MATRHAATMSRDVCRNGRSPGPPICAPHCLPRIGGRLHFWPWQNDWSWVGRQGGWQCRGLERPTYPRFPQRVDREKATWEAGRFLWVQRGAHPRRY
jgi:hypothetical protein